jgi:hypothetical protein
MKIRCMGGCSAPLGSKYYLLKVQALVFGGVKVRYFPKYGMINSK